MVANHGEETFRGVHLLAGGSAMDRRDLIRLFGEPVEDDFPRWSLLRRLQERRRARQLERTRLAHEQRLAPRVHEIFFGCGLTQADYSIGGGRVVHVPQLVAVDAGPPVTLDIRTLPGQAPNDFTRHASAIAYHLGVTEVRVIPLSPSLIQLELLP